MDWHKQHGVAVDVYKSKSGGWRLRDANGDTVTDENGEPYDYPSRSDADMAVTNFVVE